MDCDGDVDTVDGVLVLRRFAGMNANAPCLGAYGVDCVGGVDEADVLGMFLFLGGIPPDLPDGCPLIGQELVPTPQPTPLPTPTPTLAATLTPTPAATVTPTPSETSQPSTGSEDIDYCVFAILSYEVLNAPALAGDASCNVPSGTDWDCEFPHQFNDAECFGESSGHYFDCYFYQQNWGYCASDIGPDYQCTNVSGLSDCSPVDLPGPSYVCTISDVITCATDDAAPDFACTREGQAFACAPD